MNSMQAKAQASKAPVRKRSGFWEQRSRIAGVAVIALVGAMGVWLFRTHSETPVVQPAAQTDDHPATMADSNNAHFEPTIAATAPAPGTVLHRETWSGLPAASSRWALPMP